MTRSDHPRVLAESPCPCTSPGYCPHYRRAVEGREWDLSRQRSHLAMVMRLGWLRQVAQAEGRSREGAHPRRQEGGTPPAPTVIPPAPLPAPAPDLEHRPICKHLGRRVRLDDGTTKTRRCALG